ncbi:MAG TPA: Uma2 family endonuclease [Gemmataceae bacterium]|jgi:Uma2 family endonuclease|nr:Uma2 family endonuclease [Gemmataceae bacterium]
MAPVATTKATLDDLAREDGKAELVRGWIVRVVPSGDYPSSIAGEIFVSLRAYAKRIGRGKAYADRVGFTVPELPSGRESFSPDASYFDGVRPIDRMRFIPAAPKFAAEVRSENDYGPAAEVEMAAKRADYFAAGTLTVWDVDPEAQTIAVFRAAAPTQPTIFRSGDQADAEPAVPGWRIAVDDIFAD